jgi:thioredoxin 1
MKHIILTTLSALFLMAASANAAQKERYTDASFDAAQQKNVSIIIDVTAPWCPTCRAQKPIIEKLASDKKYSDVVILEIDFDSQKDALRRLKVNQQSTLIAFKGKTEKGRSVGDTTEAGLRALFDKAAN